MLHYTVDFVRQLVGDFFRCQTECICSTSTKEGIPIPVFTIIALYNDNAKNVPDFGMWNGRTRLPEHDHLEL